MKKVLIVDDELSIVTYLTAVLDDAGYATCSATDGERGLQAAREEKPDLICLDIMMPRRSGISLFVTIRTDSDLCRIPVIFISAFNDLKDLRDPVSFRKTIPNPDISQPERCLEKPLNVPEFIDSIAALIGEGSSDPS